MNGIVAERARTGNDISGLEIDTFGHLLGLNHRKFRYAGANAPIWALAAAFEISFGMLHKLQIDAVGQR